jgi:hypothetical protein
VQIVGEPHHLLAQPQVAMERRQVLVHAVDQTRVDGGRDVRPVESRLEVRGVLARLGVEQHLLHFRIHGRAVGTRERAERREERRHRVPAVVAVRPGAQLSVARLIDLGLAAVAQRDRRIGKVGIRQDAVDVRRRPGHRPRFGEKLLLGIGQRVRRAADDVVEVEVVDLQATLRGDEAIDRLAADVQDLGLDVGGLRREAGVDLLHLLLHAVRARRPRVLVGEHAGVDVEARQLLVQPRRQLQRVGQRLRRGSELALEVAQLRQLRDDLFLLRAPGALARIDVRQIPGVFHRDLGPIAFLRRHQYRHRHHRGGRNKRPNGRLRHGSPVRVQGEPCQARPRGPKGPRHTDLQSASL